MHLNIETLVSSSCTYISITLLDLIDKKLYEEHTLQNFLIKRLRSPTMKGADMWWPLDIWRTIENHPSSRPSSGSIISNKWDELKTNFTNFT